MKTFTLKQLKRNAATLPAWKRKKSGKVVIKSPAPSSAPPVAVIAGAPAPRKEN